MWQVGRKLEGFAAVDHSTSWKAGRGVKVRDWKEPGHPSLSRGNRNSWAYKVLLGSVPSGAGQT